MRSDDPRDYCEIPAELAREVLNAEELSEYQQTAAERSRVANLARRHRAERLRPPVRDPWAEPDGAA